MADRTAVDRDLSALDQEMRTLEIEYGLFFSGRRRLPPLARHARVRAEIERLGRGHIESSTARFQLNTLQHRYYAWTTRWDRELRACEEGRAVSGAPPLERAAAREAETGHAVTLSDPANEMGRVRALYDELLAQRIGDEEIMPFHQFAERVREEIRRAPGAPDAAVVVEVSDVDGRIVVHARRAAGR